MNEQGLALSETMQVHEMLNLKTVCMTTSKMMQGIVFDQDLKALMAKDVEQSIFSIAELQKLLSKAPTLK
jgi:similar to spore coat protein